MQVQCICSVKIWLKRRRCDHYKVVSQMDDNSEKERAVVDVTGQHDRDKTYFRA